MNRELACTARILAAVTFHFDPRRLGFLAEALRSLARYPVQAMDIVIATNTFLEDELRLLSRLGGAAMPGARVWIRSYGSLPTPWHLTWAHKEIIAEEFLKDNAGRYTHFIYLESDIRLSFENFYYFCEYKEPLRDTGLLPAFVRVEYNTALAGFTTSDVFWPVYVPVQPHVRMGDIVFLNLPNAYNPFFILDVEMTSEYVRFRSFDLEGSRQVCRWGLAERAALGLCLENLPAPFYSRYVVPVSRSTGMTPAAAWAGPLPNNYANNPSSPLAKVRVDRLFVGTQEVADDDASREPDGAEFERWNRFSGPSERELAHTDTEGGVASEGDPRTEAETSDSAASVLPGTTEGGNHYYMVSHFDTIPICGHGAKGPSLLGYSHPRRELVRYFCRDKRLSMRGPATR